MPVTQDRNPHQGHLTVISDLSVALIRARIEEIARKERLDRAIRTSMECGASVDSLSEASGYDPIEIRKISETQGRNETLAVITGIA